MLDQHVLVLNCGSSSLKFAILDAQSGDELITGLAECLISEDARLKYSYQGQKQTESLIANASHQQAITRLVDIIKANKLERSLIAVGHRVVHGGEHFTQSVVITEHVKQVIADTISLAPLHNPANLVGIEAAEKAFDTLPQVAVFDTAFHQTMPKHAYLYALPYELYQQHGVRRYGFHGTSHHYVAKQAATVLQQPFETLALISAHLGNGCSVTAIKNGVSVDTSMGLTPLEGVVMGTRSGDIDPGLFNFLTQQLGYSAVKIDTLLNKQSGLLGLSKLSNDCRTIEDAHLAGNAQASLALEVFCYRLAKQIAAYVVPLGTLDGLIFTGGIGENSQLIRQKVIDSLNFFGFKLNEQANSQARFGQSGVITSNQTGPQALVIPTNEEWMIARDAAALALEVI
ncbi:acetate kinase [Pseudoalteromonas ulvae]|uniref:Acetate kinase n=1 Tax=Pseudoalteromonas ulvae TaxID=107327 RepID=A0A244CTG2_PSEDV|nr:acetate kinase [Pseudoalteromonas ulvae]OUL58895.1 acetate kinase [Pseudoalteromonas ulvae]